MISLTLFIKTSTKNWYPNDEKNLVKYAFKILRLCHGGHFDHYGPGCRGISWKNQQAEADRIAQRVLTEVVTDLETSYQTGHTRRS